MDRHRRDPYPRSFQVITARESDNRFYGLVVKQFGNGRLTAPEAVALFGENLNPAEIKMSAAAGSNRINLEVKGIQSFDLWISPRVLDVKGKPDARVNVRLNRRDYISGRRAIIKLDLESMLDDLRVRGDRQQLYWHRISIQ
jgi:hypothetical protein